MPVGTIRHPPKEISPQYISPQPYKNAGMYVEQNCLCGQDTAFL